MKNHIVSLFLLAATMCARVYANESKAAIPVTKIFYQRQIPQSVKIKMPSGSKTRFFGISQLEPKGSPVAFHLYELSLSSEGHWTAANPFYLPNCVLDVFFQSLVGKHRIFRRVSSLRLNSIRYSSVDFSHDNNFRTVGMSLLWLDAKQRTIPILKIDAAGPALYPDWGTNLLITFPMGFESKAVVQGFGHGSDNGPEHNGWGSTFDQVDQKGSLVVHTFRGSFSETGNYNTPLYWNGKEFAPISE